MRPTFLRTGLLTLVLLASASSQANHLGSPPADTLGARDIASEYHLPPLHDAAADPLGRSLAATQVIRRAVQLGLSPHSATQAWADAAGAFQRAAAAAVQPLPDHLIPFSGSRASELNRAMAAASQGCAFRILSPILTLDEPLYPGSHCTLDLGTTRLQSMGFQPYQLQIKGRVEVRIQGGRFTGGRWGVSVARSRNVLLTGMDMQHLSGGGVMVTSSRQVTVAHNRFRALGGAGVMLHGHTVQAVITANEMLGDTGWSNWHAGIVVTDRNPNPADNSTALLRDDGILVRQERITNRLTIPHDNVILGNHIADNKTSGIYSDGGARNLFLQNTIENNSKEGMCLDNGSTANVVAFNLFRGNGKRWGMTDADLRRDFVSNYGRLPDGTSPAKLPGISMDNALYNQVLFNEIDRNFGSGIKMVRSDFFNLIGVNTLTDDNEGANAKLHYFGILVGYARSDEPAWDLDFVPSRGNQIFANNIRGPHFAGIFFEDGADHNMVLDNSIFGATTWAMDSFRVQPEESFNNLSNLPLRNIDSGLDPNLLILGKGRREP